jgi:hypothetical protein
MTNTRPVPFNPIGETKTGNFKAKFAAPTEELVLEAQGGFGLKGHGKIAKNRKA